MTDILYRSDEVEVRRVAGDGARACRIVTFHSHHDGNGLDHPSFGEAFFAREGIEAIHVLCRGNDWYQYAEMPAVAAAIRAATEGAGQVVTYGTSMGGYAAIRFAKAVGAHAALAISPQYSVDRRKMRFERRWVDDQARIGFLPAVDGRVVYRGRVIIAYDPELIPDRLHVERFEADVPVEHVQLPYAGHPASTYLHEIGMLQSLVLALLTDTLDVASFVDDAAQRATLSPAYLIQLSATKPPAEAIALAEQALALAPDTPYVLTGLSNRLAAADEWPRAIEVHRRAVELYPSPAFRWSFARALEAGRYLDEALVVTRALQDEAPHVARYHRHAAKILATKGDYSGAREAMRAAIRCAPADHNNRWMAFKLGWRSRRARWFG